LKRSLLLCFVALTTCFSTLGQSPPASGLILPGSSVAGVKLGSHFADFEAVFPKHPPFDEDMPDSQCAGRIYHWLDLDQRANGVYAYLKNDQIYQLSVQTPRFTLSNGIGMEASERRVKRAYPRGRMYVLLGSGSAANGGRDLIYWVDQPAGVAFEFDWDRRKHRRSLAGIDVFRKGSRYFPDGCISPPQQWRERPESHRNAAI
jgi:hypothetical protein